NSSSVHVKSAKRTYRDEMRLLSRQAIPFCSLHKVHFDSQSPLIAITQIELRVVPPAFSGWTKPFQRFRRICGHPVVPLQIDITQLSHRGETTLSGGTSEQAHPLRCIRRNTLALDHQQAQQSSENRIPFCACV